MAALTNGLRNATVIAEEESLVLCVSRSCLFELLHAYPKLRTVLARSGVVHSLSSFAKLSLAS